MTDRLATVKIPDGYRDAQEFARDCGVEIVFAQGDTVKIVDDDARINELRGLVKDLTTALENRNRALEESIKLQSHYAGLLNQMDGGRRLQFTNAQAWEERLRSLKEKTKPYARGCEARGIPGATCQHPNCDC